jgi:hypothetical protein
MTPGRGEPRWEYKILWRYGPHLMIVVGLLAMGFGAAGVRGTAISLALLPIGFVCLVAGVLLPRIEGKVTVAPNQLTADVLAVHTLDQLSITTSTPAVTLRAVETIGGVRAIEAVQSVGAVTLGDVWDAFDALGIRPGSDAGLLNYRASFEGVGLGHAYFRLADGRRLKMPNRSFLDWAGATDELLALVASWGITPSASGKYPVPHSSASSPVATGQRQTPVFFMPPDEDFDLHVAANKRRMAGNEPPDYSDLPDD